MDKTELGLIARRLITDAEKDLGKLSFGQKTDLLLDNMGLNSILEAKNLLRQIGETE